MISPVEEVAKTPNPLNLYATQGGVWVNNFVDNFLKYWEKFGKKLVQDIVKTT